MSLFRSHLYSVKCLHCGTDNTAVGDLKNAGCQKCKLPLNWSLPKGTFIPNFVPLTRRLQYLALSVVLLVVFGVSLVEGGLYIPYFSKKATVVAHFSGYGLILPLVGMGSAVVVAISVLLDHFDVRNNEKTYSKIQAIGGLVGVLCYIIAVFWADRAFRIL